MDPVELGLHRANTDAFIAFRPSTLVLTPVTRQRLPAGGFKEVSGTPRAAQVFRITEPTAPNIPILLTQDGSQREVDYFLLGRYDADIAVGDWWRELGREWTVAEVVRDNGYETRALVWERGK